MQVTKITTPTGQAEPAYHPYSEEQLQNEFDFLMAEKLTQKMLEKGLISTVQYDKIMAENRRSFSPFLSEILA